MILLSFVRRAAACFAGDCFLQFPLPSFAQTNYYATNGTEYAIIGSLPGDQVFPDAAVNTNGGFVVWQDNITDGDGWGISARQVDGTLSGTLGTFRVNQQGAGDQENPRVALLKNGGAVFVWQGGQKGFQHIYAAFVNANNTFVTTKRCAGEHTFTNNFQINPAVTTLTNGNVVVVWGSFDEAGSNSLQDVYGQIFSPTGQPITGEFLINQFTSYNQRTPAVAALANGGFVVAWVSEQERVVGRAESGIWLLTNQTANIRVWIFMRGFTTATALPKAMNFWSTRIQILAPIPMWPPVRTAVSWWFGMRSDMTSPTTNSLDIYARSFSSAGAGSGSTVVRVNSYLYGDQYAPRISSLGTDYLVVWTSLGQDGSREGVYGQFLHENSSNSRRRISCQYHDHQLSKCSRWWLRTARASFWWFGRVIPACPTVLICLRSVISTRRPFCSRWPRRLFMRRLSSATVSISRNCRFPGRRCWDFPFPITKFMWMARRRTWR